MFITVEHVSRMFDGRMVLDDVSLTLPPKGAVCFFGPSGCGKTTLLRLLCGLDKPDAGRVAIPAGTRFSCHFQEDRLLPWYTAEKNLALALGSVEMAREWLTRAGLSDAAARYPDELSGGMRRRVSLVRALGHAGDVLVLDEPLRELDAPTAERMLTLIADSMDNRLLILVTHDREQAVRLGCKIIDFPFTVSE